VRGTDGENLYGSDPLESEGAEEQRESSNRDATGDISSSEIEEKWQPSDTQQFNPDEHEKKCPDCAEYIKLEARVCKHCGHEFSKEEVEEKIEERKKEIDRQRKKDDGTQQTDRSNANEETYANTRYNLQVDGHDIEVTPKGSEVPPYSCISSRKFDRWFNIISKLQTDTMVSSGSVLLLDVRFHGHRREDTLSQDMYIFNAISIRDIDVLDRVSFVRNGELKIDIRENSELHLCMPRYVSTDDSSPLSSIGTRNPQPVDELVEGERYDIKVGYARTAETTYGNISEKTVVDDIEI
jgi:hypothetical protein